MAANSAVVGQQVAKKEPFERLAREARERYLLAKEDWATTTDDLMKISELAVPACCSASFFLHAAAHTQVEAAETV